MANKVLRLEYDSDTPGPLDDEDWWKIVSFSTRHSFFEHPDKFIRTVNVHREIIPATIGLRRKLEAGTAFWLSCYIHSGTAWSMRGEGMRCQFDTTDIAGLLHFGGKLKYLTKDRKEREKSARSWLESFNEWLNGNCYYFSLETAEGEDIHSCGCFYGVNVEKAIAENINEELEPGDKLVVGGDAKWLVDYMQLNAEIVDEHEDEVEEISQADEHVVSSVG